jgi:hypothetical protein
MDKNGLLNGQWTGTRTAGGIFFVPVHSFDFSVMGEGSRLHAGEPPALHIASDTIA